MSFIKMWLWGPFFTVYSHFRDESWKNNLQTNPVGVETLLGKWSAHTTRGSVEQKSLNHLETSLHQTPAEQSRLKFFDRVENKNWWCSSITSVKSKIWRNPSCSSVCCQYSRRVFKTESNEKHPHKQTCSCSLSFFCYHFPQNCSQLLKIQSIYYGSTFPPRWTSHYFQVSPSYQPTSYYVVVLCEIPSFSIHLSGDSVFRLRQCGLQRCPVKKMQPNSAAATTQVLHHWFCYRY